MKPVTGKFLVDGLKHFIRQPMAFQQPAEFQQCCSVRRRFEAQVHAHEAPDRLHTVDGIFGAFVRKAEDVLNHIHPQHALEPDRRTTVAGLG